MSCSDSDPHCISYPTVVFSLEQIIVEMAAESFGYGCFVIVAIQAVYQLICHGIPSTTSKRCLLATTLLLFSITTINYALDFLGSGILNIELGPFNSDTGAVSLSERIWPAQTIPSRINYVCADAIMVWRAWVISQSALSHVVLVVCLFGSIVCSFVEAAFVIKDGPFIGVVTDQFPFQIMGIIALLVTNIVATLMIVYKTWIYLTQIKAHCQNQKKPTQVEQVLYLLVESGLIYISIWVLNLCSVVIKSTPAMLTAIINGLLPHVSAIYPLIVILLVAQQKSVQDSMQDAISHSIHFGSVQPNTQNHHSLYGMSIIEMIQTRGNDQESQLHISVPETVAQEVKLTEEIGTPCSIGKGDISV